MVIRGNLDRPALHVFVVAGYITSGGLIGVVDADSSENEDKCATYIFDCSANTNLAVNCPINQKPISQAIF